MSGQVSLQEKHLPELCSLYGGHDDYHLSELAAPGRNEDFSGTLRACAAGSRGNCTTWSTSGARLDTSCLHGRPMSSFCEPFPGGTRGRNCSSGTSSWRTPSASPSLREVLSSHLQAAKREQKSREPEGDLLNKALLHQKTATKAKELAQSHHHKPTKELQLAQTALDPPAAPQDSHAVVSIFAVPEAAVVQVPQLQSVVLGASLPPPPPALPSATMQPGMATRLLQNSQETAGTSQGKSCPPLRRDVRRLASRCQCGKASTCPDERHPETPDERTSKKSSLVLISLKRASMRALKGANQPNFQGRVLARFL